MTRSKLQLCLTDIIALAIALSTFGDVLAQTDALPSWNDGPTKQAIVQFVEATTDASSPQFVPPAERIATFDQDGTLWVEHPMYSQIVYCLSRVPAVVKAKPDSCGKVATVTTEAAVERTTDLASRPAPRMVPPDVSV